MSRRESSRPQLSEGARAERRLGWMLCAPAFIIMVAVTGYPIIYAIYLSLQRYDLRFPSQAKFVGLSNYAAVLSSTYWWNAFIVTLVITVISVAIELVLGMGLAIVMHRTIIGRGTVRTSIVSSHAVSPPASIKPQSTEMKMASQLKDALVSKGLIP